MSMPTEQQQMRDTAKRTVVRASEGRGFVVQAGYERWIITAAHCLPHLPPPHGLSYIEERTYPRLLGPLDGETDVWAECLFADPVADIAVLGPPDEQALFDEYAAYETLMTDRLPVDGHVPEIDIDIDWKPGEHAEVLGLDGSWFGCQAK
jgi:hypothetical protein